MRLTVVRGPGVGGIATRTELGSESLPPDDAKTLEKRVREAGLLEDAASFTAEPSPDEQAVELTIEDETGTRTVRMSEGAIPEDVRALLDWADARPEREIRVEPPGGN